MKKIKVFSTIILIISLSIGLFTACKNDKHTGETTSAAITEAPTTEYNGYSYPDMIFEEETQTKATHTAPPAPTRKPKETKVSATVSQPETTAQKTNNVKVSEESKGLYILSKTSPVIRGNNASIIITGTPNAEYTIEFYETTTKKAAYSGLEASKSDSSGIASWTFVIGADCEAGERKVIIREKNSDKYIQTSITVI